MRKLEYRLSGAPWAATDKIATAEYWYSLGEIIEVVDNGEVINVWFQ